MSTLDLFKAILSEKDALPRDQPYKDLVNLINFILRKFFKALNEDTFLAVEVRNFIDSIIPFTLSINYYFRSSGVLP